jgi:hypothetical protein
MLENPIVCLHASKQTSENQLVDLKIYKNVILEYRDVLEESRNLQLKTAAEKTEILERAF